MQKNRILELFYCQSICLVFKTNTMFNSRLIFTANMHFNRQNDTERETRNSNIIDKYIQHKRGGRRAQPSG